MATVNTFKYRGYDKIAWLMGAQSIEHSFTQFSQIWCDENDKPLRNKETGKLFQPHKTRAWINPGAIDPEDGSWTPMTLNRKYNPYTLGVFAFYSNEEKTFDLDLMPEDPVTICVGDEFEIERQWYIRQKRALELNRAQLPYSLRTHNCHSAICYLHGDTPEKAKEFSAGRFFRWAANPNILALPDIERPADQDLFELRKKNLYISYEINDSHLPQMSPSEDFTPEDTIS